MTKSNIISLVALFLCLAIYAQDKESSKLNIEMFPTPKEGFEQFVIEVPSKEQEDDFKLEIYAGKNAEIDCNNYRLSGVFTKQTLDGWGYNYYEFSSNGTLAGTLMACPEESKHIEFIKSTSELLRYNSKVPIVIYAPKGFEIRYKIWKREIDEFEATVITN
jgi:ecotin